MKANHTRGTVQARHHALSLRGDGAGNWVEIQYNGRTVLTLRAESVMQLAEDLLDWDVDRKDRAPDGPYEPVEAEQAAQP